MWEVKTDKDTSKYTPQSLIQLLAGKLQSMTEKKMDQAEMIKAMTDTIPAESLMSTPMSHFIDVAFRLGYLYRVFLEKNNVVFTETTSSATSGEVPSGS